MNVVIVMEDVMMIVLTLLVVSIVSVTVDMHFKPTERLAMVRYMYMYNCTYINIIRCINLGLGDNCD